MSSSSDIKLERASRVIQRAVQTWLSQQRRKNTIWRAARTIAKIWIGYRQRKLMLARTLELEKGKLKIFFPAAEKSIFRVAIRDVLRKHRTKISMGTMGQIEDFKTADIRAIRFPEMNQCAPRLSSISALNWISGAGIVRQRYGDRFIGHQWAGPFHRLIDTPDTHTWEKLRKIRRRHGAITAYDRKIFLKACKETTESMRSGDRHQLAATSSRRSWPDRLYPEILVWTSPTTEIAQDTIRTLLGTRKLANIAELFETPRWRNKALIPVIQGGLGPPLCAFFTELQCNRSIAAVCIQSSWRAHRCRRHLTLPLLTVTLMHRAASCIQRCWRWAPLRKRLHFLWTVRELVTRFETHKEFFIDSWTYNCLNSLHEASRMTQALPETNLCFACTQTSDHQLVFVRCPSRADGGRAGNPVDSPTTIVVSQDKARSSPLVGKNAHDTVMADFPKRLLPLWIFDDVPSPPVVDFTESFEPVTTLQGLLRFAAKTRTERTYYLPTVGGQLLQMHSGVSTSSLFLPGSNGPCEPHFAGGMDVAFSRYGFATVEQARMCAVAIHCCVYDFRRSSGICILTPPELFRSSTAQRLMKSWATIKSIDRLQPPSPITQHPCSLLKRPAGRPRQRDGNMATRVPQTSRAGVEARRGKGYLTARARCPRSTAEEVRPAWSSTRELLLPAQETKGIVSRTLWPVGVISIHPKKPGNLPPRRVQQKVNQPHSRNRSTPNTWTANISPLALQPGSRSSMGSPDLAVQVPDAKKH
eukprot:GHVT01038113.1.p1 GENE.GHVT01038113.1~~GHVT01038113.1.p1  ORF type:complete len:756 (+),score=31.46 GHVT01038113.1:2204-4471(+)